MGGRGPGRMAGCGEKAKDFKKAWGQLIAYNKPQMPAIAAAILCASGGSILSLIGPNKLRDITNLITEGFMTGIDLPAVVKICVTLVIIYACCRRRRPAPRFAHRNEAA